MDLAAGRGVREQGTRRARRHHVQGRARKVPQASQTLPRAARLEHVPVGVLRHHFGWSAPSPPVAALPYRCRQSQNGRLPRSEVANYPDCSPALAVIPDGAVASITVRKVSSRPRHQQDRRCRVSSMISTHVAGVRARPPAWKPSAGRPTADVGHEGVPVARHRHGRGGGLQHPSRSTGFLGVGGVA